MLLEPLSQHQLFCLMKCKVLALGVGNTAHVTVRKAESYACNRSLHPSHDQLSSFPFRGLSRVRKVKISLIVPFCLPETTSNVCDHGYLELLSMTHVLRGYSTYTYRAPSLADRNEHQLLEEKRLIAWCLAGVIAVPASTPKELASNYNSVPIMSAMAS